MSVLMVNGSPITEKYLAGKMREYDLPEHMASGLFLYLVHHIPPGSFMRALLGNDFMGCVGAADHLNSQRLQEWAQFLYCEMPAGSHGSPENVAAWLRQRKIQP